MSESPLDLEEANDLKKNTSSLLIDLGSKYVFAPLSSRYV